MAEQDLIDGLQNALEDLPHSAVHNVVLEANQRSGPDVVLEVSLQGRRFALLIETLRTAYPRDVREKIWQITQYMRETPSNIESSIPMLIAGTISKGARTQLRDANVGYYDASGSLFLPAPGIYVLLDRPQLPKARKIRDAIFKGQRAVVLHHLFANRSNWSSVKEVASSTGISTATVSETLTELERREWIKTEGLGPSKVRRLSGTRELLDTWSDFVAKQRPPEIERFYLPGGNIENILEGLDHASELTNMNYAITGEAAAQLYSPFLSQISRVTCRLAMGSKRNHVLEELGARPVSEGWNFGILSMARKSEVIQKTQNNGIWLAPPLQVYLDLLQGGGRSKEMAQHLRETTLET